MRTPPGLQRLIYLSRKFHIFATKGPAYHFMYGRWRLRRRLSRRRAPTTLLALPGFLAQLNLDMPGLDSLKKAVQAGDYDQARLELHHYFRSRAVPKFFFEPGDVERIAPLIDTDQKEATISAAATICQNQFLFRRSDPVTFEDEIDWTYCPQGNVDWTWDLNRHAYFETLGRAYAYTGDERYARQFRALLLSWLRHNPDGVAQPNWSSVFEAAFRINTWTWAFYLFRPAAAFDPDLCLALLRGLLAHGRYLNTHLELHVRNNHLLLEAKALAMLGLLFPEFREANGWQQRGLKLLYREVKAQVCADGVHGERATHYHRVIAGELLELLVLLENNNIRIPLEMIETLAKMVEFELWVTKPNGLIPLLADSALEDTHLRLAAAAGGPVFLKRYELKGVAPAPKEAEIWLLGAERLRSFGNAPIKTMHLDSRAFPEGGYFIMRSGHGFDAPYLVFDCGPFGYDPVPGHGHADALSFELHAFGRTLLVDPGVYSTHLGQDWRNFFRSSRAHNTLTVDGQDQSLLLDSWRVYRPARTTLKQWLSDERYDFVDGSHTGYQRLGQPITHRRQILFIKPEYWVIIDVLTGQGRHCFDLFFHLPPGFDTLLDQTSGRLRAGKEGDAGLIIAPLGPDQVEATILSGDTAPIQGWVSFYSGEKLAAPVLRYRFETNAPVQFCTVLYPFPAGNNVSVAVSPLEVAFESEAPRTPVQITGLQLETDKYVDLLIVDRGAHSTGKIFGGYSTDAHLVYLRRQKDSGSLEQVIVRGGSRLSYGSQSVLSSPPPISTGK